MSADEVRIRLGFSTSRVDEIGGGRIDVRLLPISAIGSFFRSLFMGGTAGLETRAVEGDEIYLENTHAETVRGKNVVLGSGCVVDVVEYSGSLSKLEGARVREERKI